MLPAMDTTMTATDTITATLPSGYRAREFRDSDREPWTEERNAQVHELQRGTAEEWREWEQIDPPKFRLRVSVDAPDGSLAAGAELGPGFLPREDGTLFGGVNVMRAHRRKGLGDARQPQNFRHHEKHHESAVSIEGDIACRRLRCALGLLCNR